jgi:hypothetical protein
LFEVLSPLGRQFSEIREWPYEEKDWAADFAHASSTAEALAAVRVVANDGDLLVRELRSKELVSAQGLQEFTDLTLECRRFAE